MISINFQLVFHIFKQQYQMKILSGSLQVNYSHKNNDTITLVKGSIFNKGLNLSELIVWPCKWQIETLYTTVALLWVQWLSGATAITSLSILTRVQSLCNDYMMDCMDDKRFQLTCINLMSHCQSW